MEIQNSFVHIILGHMIIQVKLKQFLLKKEPLNSKTEKEQKIKLEKWELEYCGEFIFFKSKKK